MDDQEQLAANPRGEKAILHDINNLLMTVASLVVRTRNTLGADDGGHTHRMMNMLGSAVGETLTLARAGRRDAPESSFAAAPYVSEHVTAFAGLFNGTDRFSVTLRPECSAARITLPPIDLLRVLTNLIRNAEQASRPEGTVELALGVITSDDAIETLGAPLPPGAYVSFQVIDSGCGFNGDPQSAGHAPERSRRGLGLDVTIGLLGEAGGALRVTDRPSGGTVVEALLPAAQ